MKYNVPISRIILDWLIDWLRPQNINWQDWNYTLFVVFICYSQTFDVTMQYAETNLLRMSSKTLDWNSNFQVDFQSIYFYIDYIDFIIK